jgi:hypothetical protein
VNHAMERCSVHVVCPNIKHVSNVDDECAWDGVSRDPLTSLVFDLKGPWSVVCI